MSKLGRSFLASATALSRGTHGVASQSGGAIGQAGESFWQRLASAAATAVHVGGGTPPVAQQCNFHPQLQPLLPQISSLHFPASPKPVPNGGCALPSVATQQHQRGFATGRSTRASRSGGKQAAAAQSAAQAQAAAKDAAATQQAAAGPSAAELAAEERERKLWHSAKPVAELSEADVGKFVEVGASSIPEAFQEYYAEASARGETLVLKGGCKGLQEEVATTGTQLVMYRQFMHELIQTVAGETRRQLYLDGPAGAGKSVALAALADWGRSSGWLVTYVPSASLFMGGGFFHKNEEATWDTPDAAKLLMRTISAQHAQALATLPAESRDGSLADLIAAAVATNDPHAATAAAVELLRVLQTQSTVPVLFVVDDWNALYWTTGYHEWPGGGLKRRNILPTELRLANAVKALLTGPPPAKGIVVAATTRGPKISTQLAIPRPKHSLLRVPCFSEGELALWLEHQSRMGVMPEPDDDPEATAAVLFHLTNGNPHELRRHGAGLLL